MSEVEALARKWGLQIEARPQFTFAGEICFVRRGAERLVLKIPSTDKIHAKERQAWKALRHFDGRGSVRLINYDKDGSVLLERAIPGTQLTERPNWMGTLCAVANRLHAKVAPNGNYSSVEAGLYLFGGPIDKRLPAEIVNKGRRTLEWLCRSQVEKKLLHGDLHPENVLLSSRGWLSIDPRQTIGEPAYEIAVSLRYPAGNTRSIRDRGEVSARFGFCPERVFAWAFAQAIIAAIWEAQHGNDPSEELAAAEAVLVKSA